MTRNNEERFAAPAAESDVAAVSQMNDLKFVVPTEIVDLPSEGRFYPEGHPLYGKTTVEMKQMSTPEEDILSNSSYIKKGVVLDRLLESLLIDRSINIGSLLLGDKNKLLHAARIEGYGTEYKALVGCVACLEQGEWNYDLSQAEERTATAIEEEFGFKYSSQGTFLITLPKTKAVVECKFLTGKEEDSVQKIIEQHKKHNLKANPTRELYRKIIVSVNGKEELVRQLIESIPIQDSKFLKREYKKRVPNVKMAGEYTCPNCDYEDVREVPFTTEFFWPK